MATENSCQSGGQHVVSTLVDAGIETVVGIPGTQTLPLDKAIANRDDIEYVMARHETAIPHIAWGYYEASNELAATVTIPGPGDTNAMHGLKNALNDCVPFLHISAEISPSDRGKSPLHEIDSTTFDSVVKENIMVNRARDLAAALSRAVETATTPPFGPVRLANVVSDGFVLA